DNSKVRGNYREGIKPFSFLLSAQIARFGHPAGADPTKFHLVARYERDSRKWLTTEWTDIHSGVTYPVTTGSYPHADFARVKSFGDILAEFRTHPEPKSAGPNGEECDRTTVGLLRRRHVQMARIVLLGKESNKIDDVKN